MKNDSLDTEEISIKRLGFGIVLIPTLWSSVAGIAVVAVHYPILHFTPRESLLLLGSVVPVGIIGCILAAFRRNSQIRRIGRFLTKHEAGEASESDYLDIFGMLINLPRGEAIFNQGFWTVVPVVTLAVTYFGTDTFTVGSVILIAVAAISWGFYSQFFLFVQLKNFLEPYRNFIATQVPDLDLRKQAIRPVPVALKIALVTASLVVVSTLFSVSLARVRIVQEVDAFTARNQSLYLDTLQDEAERAAAGELAELSARPAQASLGTMHFLVVKRTAACGITRSEACFQVIEGDAGILLPGEIEAILSTNKPEGDSGRFNSANSFTWKTLPDGEHLFIAVLPKESLEIDIASQTLAMVLISIAAVVLALFGAFFLGNDVVQNVSKLSARVGQLASGDLRRGEIIESEDELGDLGRGVEQMSLALRSTVSRVAGSADRVENAANEIAASSVHVADSSTAQNESIWDVTSAMEQIGSRAEEIGTSTDALETSVQRSSLAVQALQSMGEGLTESGSVLSSKVAQATQAFEGMFESIESVVSCSEVLANAAEGTTTSAHEMAEALREIDENAGETSNLSGSVVESAEEGQATVQETIRGIGSIRDHTNTVAELVNDLGGRTQEIDAITGVISNVADETNLLALNAAIIAAQAGEHGRAFSVVADEIKDLADRVLVNTSEITDVINAVQDGATRTIDAIAKGEESVQEGVRLSIDAGASLETITRSARESGDRMGLVVRAVQEQSEAARQMVQLMEHVISAVEEIRTATGTQSEHTSSVLASNASMSDAATQVHDATRQQQDSTSEITENVGQVRDVALEITRAVAKQTDAVQRAMELLENVTVRAQANEQSTDQMTQASRSLLQEAESLREDIANFKID